VRKFIAALFYAAVCTTVLAQQALNNDSVMKMVKAGLSDDVVVATINSSPGQYATTPDDLIALKQAGVSDKVIGAMVAKGSTSQASGQSGNGAASPAPAQPSSISQGPESPNPASSDSRPRVYLESASKGGNRNAERDQSMEMSKDFESDCSGIRVTINQQAADYTVLLNHIEYGLLVRDNQIQIANKDGDLISKTKEGGSIRGDVKKACSIILADWGTQHH
jgi:hypothetical protein